MLSLGKLLLYYVFFMTLLMRFKSLLRLASSSWLGRATTLYFTYVLYQRIKPRQSVAGRLILVTGGARGIGKAIGLELAGRGARVVLWDLSADALNQAQTEIENLGFQCWGSVVDVSDRKQVHEAAEALRSAQGPLWGLINNAGIIGNGKSFVETSEGEAERIMNVNFLAHVWTIKEFLPDMMKRNEGHIVAVSSFGGMVSSPGMAVYSASKAAVISLVEGVRLELRKAQCFNVSTSIICPGHVLTDLFAGFKTNQLVMPSLAPKYVAGKVVEALQRQWPLVIMPFFGNLAVLNKAILPPLLCDYLSELGGVSKCMDSFKGRTESWG